MKNNLQDFIIFTIHCVKMYSSSFMHKALHGLSEALLSIKMENGKN